MIDTLNLPLILLAAFITSATPGPATLAIAGTSMNSGRPMGLALAAGITTGSLAWSVAAALGLGALMLAHAWVIELVRYLGAGYLLYLAFRSARSAMTPGTIKVRPVVARSLAAAYAKGLAIHLTNPKAILFFGSLYAIGIPQQASFADLALVICAVGLQSILIFHGYALLFSSAPMMAGYARLRRWFEAVFAMAFGAASLKILTARVE